MTRPHTNSQGCLRQERGGSSFRAGKPKRLTNREDATRPCFTPNPANLLARRINSNSRRRNPLAGDAEQGRAGPSIPACTPVYSSARV